jgi:hypothetical protein
MEVVGLAPARATQNVHLQGPATCVSSVTSVARTAPAEPPTGTALNETRAETSLSAEKDVGIAASCVVEAAALARPRCPSVAKACKLPQAVASQGPPASADPRAPDRAKRSPIPSDWLLRERRRAADRQFKSRTRRSCGVRWRRRDRHGWRPFRWRGAVGRQSAQRSKCRHDVSHDRDPPRIPPDARWTPASRSMISELRSPPVRSAPDRTHAWAREHRVR